MRTAVLTIRKEPSYRRAAFESMLKRHGYTIALGSPPLNARPPKSREDLLVLWNRKRGHDEDNANWWERHGGTVLVVENGYLQKVDKTYYAISIGQHHTIGYPTGNEDRFSKLGFEVKDWATRPNGYVLVIGQRGIGSPLMASPHGWAEKHVKLLQSPVPLPHLRNLQGVPVKLRAHPGNFVPKVPLEKDLANARQCHIWSSGAGVRALVEGVAVNHYAPHWVCEEWNSMKWAVAGWDRGREAALHRMAHGQWHHEEIATGEPLARILETLKWAE